MIFARRGRGRRVLGAGLGCWIASGAAAWAEFEVVAGAPPEFKLVGGTASTPFLSTIVPGLNPWGVDLDPETGELYVSDPTARRILRIDPGVTPPTVSVLLERPGSVLHGIALDAVGRRLFFLDSGDDSVNVLDLDTLVATPLVVGEGIQRPNDIVHLPERDWLVVTDSGRDLLWVVGASGSILEKVTEPATEGAWGIARNPVDGSVFFSSFTQGTVHRLDPDSLAVTPVAAGLNGPRGLEFDRFGRLFCLESGWGQMVQVPLPGEWVSVPALLGATNGRDLAVFDNQDRDGDLLPDEWERRFAPTVFQLDGASDPEGDGRSAMDEFFFNGTPRSGADGAPVKAVRTVGEGGLELSFEGPSSGVVFNARLSSDLSTWNVWEGELGREQLEDPMYSRWTLTVDDPALFGLEPGRVFAILDGEVPVTAGSPE